jgi:glycosyl-4,4'-diaponeurosporenoate acyltransferase
VSPLAAVAADAAVWAAWGTAVGWAASRVPGHRIPRVPTWPAERHLYERLGVRRWKAWLPDAAGVFGGTSKRRLPSRGRAGLVAYDVEARRAELVHLVVPAALVAFPLWNPWPLTAVMAAYAVAANGPCLVAIRYNRVRIDRALAPC